MIRLIEALSPALAFFCARDVIAARIYASMQSYGFGQNTAQFWVQEDMRGEISTLFSLIDGHALLFAAENADVEELAVFLRMLDWRLLHCGKEMARRLALNIESEGCVMRFAQARRAMPPGFHIKETREFDAVYDMLEACGFSALGDRSLWMADLALRCRRGTAQPYFLCEESGKHVGTVSAAAVTKAHAFLGGVGILPETRGKGLGGFLVTSVAHGQQAQGREVTLFCRSGVEEFYTRIGFVRAGTYCVIMKEIESDRGIV
ncbi:MAG: GNAT family N-acetyltransferase [Oscillospiraceae bacterium]|jgi:ribosomal protein S18 acetylase RimI-like enzyme|nr:GNAT family N-acetyltransferase [Oscillospiraceae bacterium]